MATIAGQYGRDVAATHACCNRTIVTTLAGAYHIIVIDRTRGDRCPGRADVAGFANAAGENVCQSLARRNCIVMTRNTGARHFGMIDGTRRHRRPDCGDVAGLAQGGGVNVTDAPAGGYGAIVATDASLRTNTAVIKPDHRPVQGAVTGIAGSHSRNMCEALADGNDAIVTTFTATLDLGMIDQRTHWGPGAHYMTGLAQTRGGDVLQAFSGSGDSVMTTEAGRCANRAVIESDQPVRR